MINKSAIGFTLVLLMAGIGVDYYQQSMKQNLEIGELTQSGYIDTIKSRIDVIRGVLDEKKDLATLKERQDAGAHLYLPKPPYGWVRRTWEDGDNSQITNTPVEKSGEGQDSATSTSFLKSLADAEKAAREKQANAQTWVYQRGNDIVSVRAWFLTEAKPDLFSSAEVNTATRYLLMGKIVGWGVVQGVAFGQPKSTTPNSAPGYTRLVATFGFGDEINLEVRSNAGDETIYEILNAIDYDGMNSLLPYPLPFVGKDAPEIESARQKEMAGKMIAIRNDLIKRRSKSAGKALTVGDASAQAMDSALRETGFYDDNTANEQEADALTSESDDAQPKTDGAGSGGIGGIISKIFGKDEEPEAAAAPVKRLQTNGGSIANCTRTGKGKRCVIQSD